MKRSHTIGFDARSANGNITAQGNYSRFIIDAISEACPRHGYFRMYVTDEEPCAEYELLASRHNVESMEPDGVLWRRLPRAWRLWHVSKDAKRGDVELYHGLDEVLPYGLSRRNIRGVVTIHSLDFCRLRSYYNPVQRLWRRLILHDVTRRADRVVAVSECVKRDLVRYVGVDAEKVDVIYSGCHPRFAEPLSEQRLVEVAERYNLPDRYILNVGTQSERKNIGHIVETLKKLDDDLHLVVVGRATSYTRHILRRIESLGLSHRVHLIHDVTDEDMPAIYRRAELFVYTSLYEGFATAIVEALTVGVPVIALKGSSMEEAGGPNSIYLNSNDCDALLEEIVRLLGDAEERHRMVIAGKEYASRFRSEVVAYNVLKCYKRIGVEIGEW